MPATGGVGFYPIYPCPKPNSSERHTIIPKLLLLRHGQSTWNLENRFTRWTDVDLTKQDIQEARQAGQLLRAGGYEFDLVCTSLLKRAIRTMWIVLVCLEGEGQLEQALALLMPSKKATYR